MILVTGGTGLVGSHLLYRLTSTGTSVRAIHRKSSNLDHVKKIFGYYTAVENAAKLFQTIDWVEADILDIPALEIAFQNTTEVYHCAAFIHFDPRKYTTLKKVNVEGTANIVNQCLIHHIKKLCYVSSIATLGSTTDGSLITEETHFNQDAENSVYSLTKYAAEMEVWRGIQEGLDTVIVNPGVIIGPGFWNTGSGIIIQIGAKGVPIYTSGTVGLVAVDDVIDSMVNLMKSPLINERYILVGATISFKDLLSKIAMLCNKKPPRKAIAKWKLLVFCSIDWLLSIVFRSKRKLLRATVQSLYTKSTYSSKKIKKDTSFIFTPLDETLTSVVALYKIES